MIPLLVTCFTAFVPLHAVEKSESRPTTLFAFDDHSIPWKSNLKLTLVKPDKHPDNPLVRRGGEGTVDEKGVQFYGSVVRHDGKFKMWYIAMDDSALRVSRMGLSGMVPAYAESDDGIHWKKPELGLVEHQGNTRNNLVLMDPPGTCGIHLIVIHEPDDPDPTRQFKMMLTSLTRLEEIPRTVSTSIPFFSSDGLRWRSAKPLRFENGRFNDEDLAMPRVHFEQGGLFRWNGMYHLAGQQVAPWVWQPDGTKVGRVMSTFRSPDLIHWEPGSAFGFMRGTAVGKVGKPAEDEEAHLASSVWHRGNVLLGVYGIWHGAKEWKDRTIDLGLTLSNDGLHFREPIQDFVTIPRGEEGEWDEGGLLQGQGFANVGDKTYLYYGSWDLTKAPRFPPRGGVGLVTLRRDGFGYLSKYNPETPAQCVTDTLTLKRDTARLFVNVDQISDDAPITVELLDEQSRPMVGYALDDAAQLTAAGVHQEVFWPKRNSSSIDVADAFQVRVKLPASGDARVFAIYLEE